VVRMNRAVLAAFLCSATAPATMCDPTQQMSSFSQGTMLADSRAATSRTMVAPNSMTQETMAMTDGTVVLLERPSVDKRRVEEPAAPANALPSTSTAPELELQSRLLMACLGLALMLAGGVMLLAPRR
jgi:hypothetical protein